MVSRRATVHSDANIVMDPVLCTLAKCIDQAASSIWFIMWNMACSAYIPTPAVIVVNKSKQKESHTHRGHYMKNVAEDTVA